MYKVQWLQVWKQAEKEAKMRRETKWKDVLFEKKDKVATLALNRPERFNAYSPEMRASIARAIEDVANDERIS